jgi:hypothetical protein
MLSMLLGSPRSRFRGRPADDLHLSFPFSFILQQKAIPFPCYGLDDNDTLHRPRSLEALHIVM